VTVRATRREAGPEVVLAGPGSEGEESEREVWFGGRAVTALVVRGEPGAGASVEGPAVVELPEATVAIPPGWSGAWDADGTLRLERES
jgi:N-methylhydantoinase A